MRQVERHKVQVLDFNPKASTIISYENLLNVVKKYLLYAYYELIYGMCATAVLTAVQ